MQLTDKELAWVKTRGGRTSQDVFMLGEKKYIEMVDVMKGTKIVEVPTDFEYRLDEFNAIRSVVYYDGSIGDRMKHQT